MKIIIKGRIPSKKNSKIISCRGSRPLLFPSSNYKKWHDDASEQLKFYNKEENIEIEGIKLSFFMPDNRCSDLTNKAESVMDLLVDNGFLEDDSWQITGKIELIPCGVDKENPRVEIIINRV